MNPNHIEILVSRDAIVATLDRIKIYVESTHGSRR